MARPRKTKTEVANADPFIPKFLSQAHNYSRNRGTSDSQSTWSNLAGEVENIDKGVSPLTTDSTGAISAQGSIYLCQKAYWNIAIFRNTIDIQTEFANSNIKFRGNNKRSVTFFETWYKKINGKLLCERFFREWFRSGNVFIYKHVYQISREEAYKMARAAVGKLVPLKYSILNPADMRCEGAASFVNAKYSKMINSYELARLKNPSTEDEVRFLQTLPPDVQAQIKKGETPLIPLDPQYLSAIFCGKQDYEGLAIPMYYPVLFDIDLKLEFKKMEKVIARTADYMILLITAGSEEREARNAGNINSRILSELQTLFEQESVGRVLVSDFTTQAQFVMPDLNKILGPEKYKVVNEDIANGLMNIFWGEEKFANSMVKIKVFLERLQSARESFLNNFLIPEMEAIAKELNLTEVPEPVFNEVDLKDEVEYMKLYTRMAEIGVLTPEELFESIETHALPIPENSVESQKAFKGMKDKGLYEPLIGGPKKEEAAGRPGGTKAPQKTKKVSPIGASKFSLQKISETIKAADTLSEAVEEQYRKINSIKRLTNKQKDLCWNITESIVAAKVPEDWEKSIPDFIQNPMQTPDDQCLDIAGEHNISLFLAGILKDSKA